MPFSGTAVLWRPPLLFPISILVSSLFDTRTVPPSSPHLLPQCIVFARMLHCHMARSDSYHMLLRAFDFSLACPLHAAKFENSCVKC